MPGEAAEPHWNQPGGPFLAVPHRAVAGRERELRRLADALRDLVGAIVTSVPSPEDTAAAAERLEAVAARLEGLQPPEPVGRYSDAPRHAAEPHAGAPFDLVSGLYSPLALPLRMTYDPPHAMGEGTFGTPYEGPPGLLHGGVIAGCFDIVLSSANRLAGVGGPTIRLHVRYRRPTKLFVPCRFSGRTESVEQGRIRAVGELVQGDEVTAVAEGTFADISRDELGRLAERSR